MRIPLHHRSRWKLALRIAFPLLMVAIVLDLFLPPDTIPLLQGYTLETMEIVLTTFLFTDILLNLQEARNKYSFIKRNLVRMLVVFPFAFIFRVLWVLELEYLVSPVLLGEWLPRFTNFQKMVKLERSMQLFNRFRG